jgi:P-type conjugative transfer protein TrbJ
VKTSWLAASAALVLTLAPEARAQWVVYDPSNFSQNVLTAARTLTQINNQIHGLQNQAQMILNEGQMLANQGRNLAGLVTSPLAMLQQDLQQTEQLIAEAKGLATQVTALDQQFTKQYPTSYGRGATIEQTVVDARTRWQNSLAAMHTTLDMQGQVDASIAADSQALATTVGASQNAVGLLQGVQATNQLLALLAKRAMQSQQLALAQDRASALEQSRMLEADAQGQVARAQFEGSGVAYTPAPVQVYP